MGFLQYGTCSTTTPRSPFIRDRFLEKWDPFSAEHLVVEEDAVVLVEQVLVVPVEVLARAAAGSSGSNSTTNPAGTTGSSGTNPAAGNSNTRSMDPDPNGLNRQNESNQNRSPRRR